MHATVHTASRNLFSLSNMNPGHPTEVACLYPWSHLTSHISQTFGPFHSTSVKVLPSAYILLTDINVYFLWSVVFNTH